MKETFIFLCILLQLQSCKKLLIDESEIISSQILTKEDQKQLTPSIVIKNLKEGNKASIDDNLTIRYNTARVRNATIKQHPEAVILTCIDSRVPVEDIFHKAIGSLYVLKIAGNIVDTTILGSLEYSCLYSGAKVIVVLGHDHCTSIKSIVAGINLGHFSAITKQLNPSIAAAKKNYKGFYSQNNPMFLDVICEYNVQHSKQMIRQNSSILSEMEQEKKIKIVGAIYDIQTGEVRFI